MLWFGEHLEPRAEAGPGDFIYIPPDVPHVPANASDTEWARGVVARTDPNEQEPAKAGANGKGMARRQVTLDAFPPDGHR